MIEVYTDAGSAGNPGPSGAGVFIKYNGNVIRESIPLLPMSNHEAEFHACLEALRICEKHEFSIISLRSDSKVLVESVERKFVKNPLFQPLLASILACMDHSFTYAFIKWIPSKQNKEADQLAKRAIQLAKKGS